MTHSTPAKLFWLSVLFAFWAFYGLLGRDAWKAEEAWALAPLLDWLDGSVSAWATPAPLYTLIAGGAIKLNLAGADMQASARLAGGVLTLITFVLIGLSGRLLLGPGFGPVAAIALIGGFGLMLRAHALLAESALLMVWSLLLFGVIAARKAVNWGALAIGLALPMLLFGLRGLPDLLAALLIVLLPLLSPAWCDRLYRTAVKRGLLIALSITIIAVLYLGLSGQWQAWLQWHGLARFTEARSPANAYSELPWLAWPLWPLALAAIWHAHLRLLRTAELHVPLIAVVVLLIAALVPAWSRDGALMPVLLPLALLAAYGVENLRRGAAQAFYWFGVLFFACLIVAIWVYFVALEWGYPTRLGLRLARLTPGYHAGSVDTLSFTLAVCATVIWSIATPLFPRAKSRPVLVWATGMILVWILIAALYRPWIEAGWAYRPLISALSQHLPPDACLDAQQADPAMQTMLRIHRKVPPQANCAWTLRLINRDTHNREANKAHAADGHAGLLWEGYRPRFKTQIYQLEKRADER